MMLSTVLCGCAAESEYSMWPCRFVYDNSVYLDPTLASAMTAESRGVFCNIWESTQGGALYLNFQNNMGQTTSKRETAMEQQAGYVLGLHNGIIVGFQTLNTMPNGGFVAYDVQCPNCVRRENNTLNPKFAVSMNTNGIATCPKCGKKYDLNNSGIVQNGEEGDTGLEKYVATTTGPYGFVSVVRKQ